MTDIHSCSYFCLKESCIKAQRAELREEVAMLRKTWADARTDLTTEAIENIGLRKRIAELEADAGRYRWLRETATQKTAYDVYGNGGLWVFGVHSDDNRLTFDAAIDAAMKE